MISAKESLSKNKTKTKSEIDYNIIDYHVQHNLKIINDHFVSNSYPRAFILNKPNKYLKINSILNDILLSLGYDVDVSIYHYSVLFNVSIPCYNTIQNDKLNETRKKYLSLLKIN